MMNLIPYRACYIDKIRRTMLFCSSIFNGIFRLDLKNGNVQSVGIIPNEKIFQESLYSEMIAYKEWLLLVPLAARELAVLDRESGQCIQKIKLPEGKDIQWKFVAGVIYKNSLILVPGSYPYFLSVSMRDFSVTVLCNWKEYLKTKYGVTDQKQLAAFTIGMHPSSLYMQILNTGYLLKFDMESRQFAHILDISQKPCAYALCDSKKIYVIPSKGGEILCVDGASETVEKSWHMPIEIKEDTNGYASIHGKILNHKLILFPQCAAYIGVVDLETDRVEKYSGEWSIGNKKNIFRKVDILDERYCIALVCHENMKDYGWFLIDIYDFSAKRLRMNLIQNKQEIIKNCMEKSMEQNEIIDEHTLHILGAENILNTFISVSNKQKIRKQDKENDRIGTQIFCLLERK